MKPFLLNKKVSVLNVKSKIIKLPYLAQNTVQISFPSATYFEHFISFLIG